MYVEVVFPLPFRNAFTYSVPEEFKSFAKIGTRAVVPFGKRTLTGFIVRKSETTTVKETIKPISDILDVEPIFDKKSLLFYDWISNYYLSSLGEALKLAVPYGSEIETKKKIIGVAGVCTELFEKEKSKDTVRSKILKILSEREEIDLSHLQKIIKKKNIYSALKSLEKQAHLRLLTNLRKRK